MSAPIHGLELPENAIVQTWGFLGRKGSGKTYAAGRLVEHFLDQRGQVVILDPVGNWYGLRLASGGKRPSPFEIPVLGGSRGDVPLHPDGGAVVAEFVVSTGSSCVLDVSAFRKNDRKRFVTAFAEELFHRKKAKRSPMHLVVEEAQVFAPERVSPGEQAMLGAIEDIVRLGRNVGIGASLISQRPQSVNKEVLNQVEPLVVFQLVAHHERDAVRKWMVNAGADLQEAIASLPSLTTGTCYFWSPAWLRVFERTRFGTKRTFDASATPTAKMRAAGALAPVDLEKLRESLGSALDRAKADDPKELRARIASLERELRRHKATPTEIPARLLDAALAKRMTELEATWVLAASGVFRTLRPALAQIEGVLKSFETFVKDPGRIPKDIPAPKIPGPAWLSSEDEKVRESHRMPYATTAGLPANLGKMSPTERRMVQVLVDRAPAGFTETQWATLAGLRRTGGTWRTYKSRLRGMRMIEQDGTLFRATASAIEGLGNSVPEDPADVLDRWRKALGSKPSAMLDAVLAAPGGITRDALGEATGLEVSGGSFRTYLSKLRSNGLVTTDGGIVRATEVIAG